MEVSKARPGLPENLRVLIREKAHEDPTWARNASLTN